MAKIQLQEEIGFDEFAQIVEEMETEVQVAEDEVVDVAGTDQEVEAVIEEEDVDDGLDDFGEVKKDTKVLYVTNKELLAEIHKSKMSYCEIVSDKYFFYDAIVNDVGEITPEVIEEAKARQAKRKTLALKAKLKESGAKITEVRAAVVNPEDIALEDLTFRVMKLDHVPLDPTRKRKGKGEHSKHVRTQFLPFMHVAYIGGVITEVARSHWRGDFETGHFELHRGQITKNLAKMFIMLIDRYSRRVNWRSYTYLDEMKSHALMQLTQIGLQFNEAVGDNPFAFYTTSAKNCLSGDTKIITKEFGEIEIEKVANTDVTLLDGNGEWVICHIHDHGEQVTVPTKFTKDGETVIVRSTMEHAWMYDGMRAFTTKDFISTDGKNITFKVDHLVEGGRTGYWYVDSTQVSDPKIERVYCPEVPSTASFALASGIHSGNCFTRILNLEKKNQNIRDDILIMCGSTPSFTRQNDEEHARAMKKERELRGEVVEEVVDDLDVVDDIDATDDIDVIIDVPEEIVPKEEKKDEKSFFDAITIAN